MIDTRCYSCAEEIEITDIESPPLIDGYITMEYRGGGIFKCPECSNILDLSKNTYTTIIQRKYDEFGELETEILETDRKFTGDGKNGFEQDMYELDIFDYLPVGIHKLEVLWYYYECGGCDGEEWDVKIEILSEEEIDTNEYQNKQKHLREWKEYIRNKIYTKLIQEIVNV